MLFQKSAPTVSRSALAAQAKSKKFWSSSQSVQNQTPSFFVPTPQFTRHQQSQVTPLFEDNRGTGNSDSYGLDNPYLAITAGASCGAGAAQMLIYDEESKDESHQHRSSSVLPPISNPRSSLCITTAPPISYRVPVKFPASELPISDIVEALDQTPSEDSIIDSFLLKMRRLDAAGSHEEVLRAFEAIDSMHRELPIEAYNLMFKALVELRDVNTRLQAYERMLTRGVVPNSLTYLTLINSLVKHAEQLNTKRVELRAIFGAGNSSMESVAEVFEGLAAEEYLILSQQILNAVLSSRSIDENIQSCINRVVESCNTMHLPVLPALLEYGVTEPSSLIDMQLSIAEAASKFSSLTPEEQNSEDVQSAMLKAYFRFSQAQSAIAFYSGCGAPAYLLKPLIAGFASSGYVATARRWSEENSVSKDVINTALDSIPLESASESLPSATQLFYKLIGGGGNGGSDNSNSGGAILSGRMKFIRLCVAAKHEPALLMAIRESKLLNCSWDATTTSEVSTHLAESQPLLSADICQWQVLKLRQLHDEKNLKSFVAQEIVANTIQALKSNNNLSIDASLRLLDVVSCCATSRRDVLSTIASARIGRPYDVSRIMDSERLPKITATLATFLLSKLNKLTAEELEEVKQVFPLFVNDCVGSKVQLSCVECSAIGEALSLYWPESDILELFNKHYIVSPSVSVPLVRKEVSLLIQRYALAPNGLDHAFKMLENELRVGKEVCSFAIYSVLQSCLKHNATDLITRLYNMLPKTATSLNALSVATAQIGDQHLSDKCLADLNTLGLYPTSATYIELFKAHHSRPNQVYKLFNEAKLDAKIDLDNEAYNCVCSSLAQGLKKKELTHVLQEMNDKNFSLLPQTYGPLIIMHVRLKDGYQALDMLRTMPEVPKSLLEVRVFNYLMKYFVHTNPDRNAALQVFMELRNTGTLATPNTYKLLMEAYLLKSSEEGPNVHNADQVLTLMKRDGTPITTQCFATLLRARGVICKDFDGARDFYRGLVKNSRVLPDKGIFKALMESYIINGKQEETGLVLDEMKRYHIPIDDEIAHMAVCQ